MNMTEINNVENTEAKVEDVVSTQEIKLSSGVQFTQEELEQMDPAVKAKLEKVKLADAQFTKGFNDKVAEINSLKSQLTSTVKPVETAKVETPAPKADASQVISPTDLFVFGMMTEEKIAKSKKKAIANYGEKATSIIEAEIQPVIEEAIAKGQYELNFDIMWSSAYADLSITNPDLRRAVFSHIDGVEIASNATQEADAKLAAAKEILESKVSTTTGVPQGGTSIVTPPASTPRPNGLKAAHEMFKAKMQELREGEK